MAGKVENWSELERLFVVEGKSHREIARIGGVSNSTVSQKAKRDDWEGKRIAYQASLSRRGYELTAETVANEQHVIKSEAVLVSRAYIRSFGQQLAEGKVNTNAKDALEFMKFLIGEMDPSKGEGLKDGPKVIEGSAVSVEGGSDVLRRILEVARDRSRGSSTGSVGDAEVVDPPRPLQN